MIEIPEFGRIIVDGKEYTYDIVVYPSGRVERRKKEISKKKHGTSHKLDPEELREYLTEDFDVLVVGTGLWGMLSILPESRELVKDKEIIESPTPEVAELFEKLRKEKRALGIFHITC
ncbi:Mth938-like domain-containing protein [Thermococcus piezophilus]|uniref:Uncharacterized protein n=1 Tax=Thermococcus piezophilus TaxID=1712654 RepID=A0A172WF68_9EURY|nr:Mth938-like domain-containing protein [Thermococcus piezophilus]ANF22035.1 hypothetical protein A7C91_01655 [Thermococcus piezophilus]